MTGENRGCAEARRKGAFETEKKNQPSLPPALSLSFSFSSLSRDLKRAHRDRAAWLRRQQDPKLKGDPLVREIASRLVDRLGDCSPLLSSRFRRVLLLGAEPAVLDFLAGAAAPELRSAVEEITVVDSSRGRLDLLEEERQRRDEERSAKAGGEEADPLLPPPRLPFPRLVLPLACASSTPTRRPTPRPPRPSTSPSPAAGCTG